MSRLAGRVVWVFVLGSLSFLGSHSFLESSALAATSSDCLVCHEDKTLETERAGKRVSLHVDPGAFKLSVHGALDCTDCHVGFDPTNLPHAAKIEPVTCETCHADARDKHAFHPSMAKGESPVACADCHGRHDIARASEKFSRQNLVRACASCHGDVALQFAESDHGKALAADAKGSPDCLLCHARPVTAGAEPDVAKRKLVQEKLCLSCHLDNPDVRAAMSPSVRFIEEYEKSVHGSAMLSGNGAAANCVSCHGSHEMRTGMDPKSRTSKANIPETCAQCHGAIALEYAGSVHGAALRKGKPEAPVCTDCHGEHDIYPHDDPRSPVAAANVSARVCAPCHGSLRLAGKYELSADRAKSYADSYHGLAVRGGSLEAANCASCHGAHGILPPSDPRSSVNKANIAATCGKCHEGANEKFAMGAVHVTLAKGKDPVLYWIASAYVGMILFTVGGMFFHNLLDFLRKARHRLHAHREGPALADLPHNLHLRMSLSERLQHATLVISFTVLVVTGFMLRYPEAWWVVSLRRLSDRFFDLRGIVHRIAAVAMVAGSVIHIVYVALTARGRKLVRDLWPVRKDLYDAAGVLRYNLGLTKAKPAFGRFSYIEKSEYWALVWGTIVMALTGGILWFDNTSMRLITKLGSDVARTVHFYEAILATLAIIIWHLYYVILNPDVYPMNFAWLTGTITERDMAEEHALELADIRRARLDEAQTRAEAESVSNRPVAADAEPAGKT